MKLQYLTCPKCKSHDWSQYSANIEKVTMHCRSCKAKTSTVFDYKEVSYPNITILDKEYKKFNVELEQFFNVPEFPFGVNVALVYHIETARVPETRYNATEFHYMYKPYISELSLAIESDIHSSGGTTDIAKIISVIITKAEKKHISHYEM